MKKPTWMPLIGNATVEDGLITHNPNATTVDQSDTASADASPKPQPHCILRSNIEFDQGIITCEVKLLDSESRVQLMLPAEANAASAETAQTNSSNTDLAIGLNVLGAPYGFAFWNGTWEPAGGTGHGSLLPLEEWIPLRIVARGSNIELYVHGVMVAYTIRTLRRGQIGLLLQGNTKSCVRNVQIKEDEPTCFVVMQFTEEFNILYRDVIRPTCESHGYKVVRGDDFYTTGQIMEDVIRSIRNAALIIADVTPDNANVFYEVGYAHAINKPTILLSDRKRERLPFDISGFRTLFYDNTIGGKSQIEARLKQHLEALRPQ